jgi:hypothetical protein
MAAAERLLAVTAGLAGPLSCLPDWCDLSSRDRSLKKELNPSFAPSRNEGGWRWRLESSRYPRFLGMFVKNIHRLEAGESFPLW